jgi:hypothetical protein
MLFGGHDSDLLVKVSEGLNKLNCENRNDPDLVQASLKKWWVESDFKAPNLPLSLRLKVSGCHYNSMSLSLVLLLTTVLPVLFKYCYTYCYSDSRKL